MKAYKNQSWVHKMNELGKARTPFFFVIDFHKTKAYIATKNEWNLDELQFQFPNKEFMREDAFTQENLALSYTPISYANFLKSYEIVHHHLSRGDSFLTNLTFSTPLENELELQQIFVQSKAKYKILLPEKWVCFSPETFVQIRQNTIFTYPMKGTWDANEPNAEKRLLESTKEKAEHHTVVDLLRNDLSKVASKVTVERFRYLEKIRSAKGEILQASSEIRGTLNSDWQKNLGNLFWEILPAGSISGAPKPQTLAIINKAENHERGFYTGIAGYYDGENVDTSVLIRFIEKVENQWVYKSGAGITHLSDPQHEYHEIYQKIYVPIS